MKSYKFWWHTAIIFTVVCVAKTLVFGDAYVTTTPSGYIIEDRQYGTIYVDKTPSGYIMENMQQRTTAYIDETPSGYIISGNMRGNIHPYINLNDDGEVGVGIYYGGYQENCEEDNE